MRCQLPPSRFRRIAKWTGLVVCILILGMWAVSTRVMVLRMSAPVTIGWTYGSVRITRYPDWLARPKPRWTTGHHGFVHRAALPRLTGYTWDEFTIRLPFWTILAVCLIPTVVLWHRDGRTVKPGYCQQCGYDLRASKKTCPECGTAIAPELR